MAGFGGKELRGGVRPVLSCEICGVTGLLMVMVMGLPVICVCVWCRDMSFLYELLEVEVCCGAFTEIRSWMPMPPRLGVAGQGVVLRVMRLGFLHHFGLAAVQGSEAKSYSSV